MLKYLEGHPAGWTDDLGIIADVNTYVKEVLPGWYFYPDNYEDITEMLNWCEECIQGHFEIGTQQGPSSRKPTLVYIRITDEAAASLFNMRFS